MYDTQFTRYTHSINYIQLQYVYGLPLYLMTQALDVNMILRKAATVSTPVIQIINIIIAIFINIIVAIIIIIIINPIIIR